MDLNDLLHLLAVPYMFKPGGRSREYMIEQPDFEAYQREHSPKAGVRVDFPRIRHRGSETNPQHLGVGLRSHDQRAIEQRPGELGAASHSAAIRRRGAPRWPLYYARL